MPNNCVLINFLCVVFSFCLSACYYLISHKMPRTMLNLFVQTLVGLHTYPKRKNFNKKPVMEFKVVDT